MVFLHYVFHSKFKILFKILHKHLTEQKKVKHGPGSFLAFCFSVTYIKISPSKPWPINLWSKMVEIVGKVTYFAPFCSWLKRTLLKFKLILQRCMIFMRSPTSILHICRGRYLHWSMKICKLYSLNTSCLENIYKVMCCRLTNILCNSCLCEEVWSKWN